MGMLERRINRLRAFLLRFSFTIMAYQTSMEPRILSRRRTRFFDLKRHLRVSILLEMIQEPSALF